MPLVSAAQQYRPLSRGRGPLTSSLETCPFSSGERWLWDVSARIEGAFDGFCYLAIFICRRPGFIRIYPVRDKSVRTIITCAL